MVVVEVLVMVMVATTVVAVMVMAAATVVVMVVLVVFVAVMVAAVMAVFMVAVAMVVVMVVPVVVVMVVVVAMVVYCDSSSRYAHLETDCDLIWEKGLFQPNEGCPGERTLGHLAGPWSTGQRPHKERQRVLRPRWPGGGHVELGAGWGHTAMHRGGRRQEGSPPRALGGHSPAMT